MRVVAVARRPAPRCAWCHDALGSAAAGCGCGAAWHPACAAACPTLGCLEAVCPTRDEPPLELEQAVVRLLMLCALVGAAACVVVGLGRAALEAWSPAVIAALIVAIGWAPPAVAALAAPRLDARRLEAGAASLAAGAGELLDAAWRTPWWRLVAWAVAALAVASMGTTGTVLT